LINDIVIYFFFFANNKLSSPFFQPGAFLKAA